MLTVLSVDIMDYTSNIVAEMQQFNIILWYLHILPLILNRNYFSSTVVCSIAFTASLLTPPLVLSFSSYITSRQQSFFPGFLSSLVNHLSSTLSLTAAYLDYLHSPHKSE